MIKVKAHGFTLLELVVVLVISGVIAAGFSALFFQASKSYIASKDATDIGWQTVLAIERITRDLHEASSVSSVNNDQLVITDIYGHTTSYKFDSNKRQLLRADQVLADNLQNITFTYRNAIGEEFKPDDISISTSTIRYVNIYMSFVYEQTNYDFSAMVALWNVK